MIPFTEAFDVIDRETPRLGAEIVPLAEAVGRVLAGDILADTDLPPFDRSQMDGFAVIARDTTVTPADLLLMGESAAGRGWNGELKRGEAVRIMTGARVPNGADAVQRLESTAEKARPLQRALKHGEADETVTILESTKQGKFIVRRGAEVTAGTCVFSGGERVTANMIAGIAAFGYSQVKVGRRPRVSVLSTGSEIVRIDQMPGPDQIRNSNAPMLSSFVAECGGVAEEFPLVRDDAEKLTQAIADSAENHDILVITGGVSVGRYDLTKDVLRSLGADLFFERVRLKPGKPTVFGRLGETLVFGLPGNPVSAAVTFQLFVRRAIRLMLGSSEVTLPAGFAAVANRVKAADERDTFLPAAVESNAEAMCVATPLRWLGSSDFIGFARANCLLFVPAGQSYEAGEIVRTYAI